jgi:hypothetical protein
MLAENNTLDDDGTIVRWIRLDLAWGAGRGDLMPGTSGQTIIGARCCPHELRHRGCHHRCERGEDHRFSRPGSFIHDTLPFLKIARPAGEPAVRVALS